MKLGTFGFVDEIGSLAEGFKGQRLTAAGIMGSVCCCLREDCEDYVNPNSSVYRNCLCLRCFIQNFSHVV